SGEVGELGTQVAVTGPDGESVVDGEPVVDGTEVEQALTDDLAAGSYDVVWRVTSQDGHPISGELGFTVEAGDDETEDETADETTADETADETTADETADETTAEGTADETGVEPTTEGTDDGTQDA